MQHKAPPSVILKQLICIALLSVGCINAGYSQQVVVHDSDTVSKTLKDSILSEINAIFMQSGDVNFLYETPQHFIFSIKFDLDAEGMITNISPSQNMDNVFESKIEGLKQKIKNDLFVKMGYRDIAVVVPVFLFTTAKPDYHFSLTNINTMWTYGNHETMEGPVIIFPPIYDALSTSHVTLKIEEKDLTDPRIKRDLPPIKN